MIDEKLLRSYLPFWDKLNAAERLNLIENASFSTFKSGAHIHSGEIDCNGVFLVVSGVLRTYMLSEDGREITLFQGREGDSCVLSASCILEAITFDVHIDAATDVELIIIPSSTFQSLSDQNVYVENFVYKSALDRFSDVMWIMEQVLFMSFDKRLAIFLLDEGPSINMTHEQIAKNLGSAREVVTRMLKYFSDEGYVSLSRGKVQITDRAALLNLVN